ncbi:MAG: leucyl/phenylalanyl-tRNA--protein transferase [Pseudomonadota bacterium]
MSTDDPLTPETLLRAYAIGVFPMAEDRDSTDIFWVDPRRRGILPLDGFHISRSLRRRLRQHPFEISTDTDFDGVVGGCADRPETWINAQITDLYSALFEMGFAHSLEIWDGTELAGGVYGVALGGAFFGESMFSRRRDASKIALAYLVDRLRLAGFSLFDTQFVTDHLRSLGGQEISRAQYHRRLNTALTQAADFAAPGPAPAPQDLLQRSTQRS